jgi:threonine/homoserine/homoserine lactone efflux protein
MPPTDHLLAFLLASFVLIVIPGPSVLFTIGRALTIGRQAALLSVAGNAIGSYLQVVAVAVGIGTLVQRSAEVYTTIKIVGAAYLIFLGVQAFRHRRALAAAVAVPTGALTARRRRLLLDGLIVGASNPKTIVFFTVALPQFADRGAGHVPVQLLVLGALFPFIALLCDSVWAVLAGTAREWLASSPRRLAAIGGAGGVAIVGLGVTVAVAGRPD